MHGVIEALKNSILITGLVIIMMILIEYINIHSQGESFRKLKKSNFRQVLFAASLGLIPGCVGGFAVVSMYTHRLLSFGALVAMMIASSGDEAFIMLALIPKTALFLFAFLFVVAIVVGLVTDRFFKESNAPFNTEHYKIHENCCDTHSHANRNIFNSSIGANLKKITKERLFILIGVALFITVVVVGLLEHDHAMHEGALHSHEHGHFDLLNERWLNLLFAAVSLVVLFMTLKANDHFIKEHLWNHIVKKHLKPIFLWTLGALLVIHFGMDYLHMDEWIQDSTLLLILLAAVVGLVPESGPHMLFITLFASGLAPLSVLVTSSIVQDGHTALPLLAESKMSFAKAKLINMVVGLTIGLIMYAVGF